MKTLKTFYLLTLSTLLSLAACSKDEGSDTPQPLTIEQTEYTLDAIDNRSTTLSFTASAAWTLSVTGEDSDWLTVTPSIGTAGSKSVTLTAAPRITEESRTAYVDIACGAQTVQITVTQTGASADADFTSLFDPVFADFLEQEDIISDVGKITRQDMETIASVTELEIGSGHSSSESLTDLRGIEFFKSLKHLGFQETAWTSLDVSGCSTLTLLYCLRTEFTKLNVSGCTALRTLDCEGDRLTSLDAGGCTALEILSCKKKQVDVVEYQRLYSPERTELPRQSVGDAGPRPMSGAAEIGLLRQWHDVAGYQPLHGIAGAALLRQSVDGVGYQQKPGIELLAV